MLQGANCRRPLARLAVRSEVVKAEQATRDQIHGVDIQLCRVPERLVAHERVAGRQLVGNPVAVPAPGCGKACIESGWGQDRSADVQVAREPGYPIQATPKASRPSLVSSHKGKGRTPDSSPEALSLI